MQIPQELHDKNEVNGQWFLKVYEERTRIFFTLSYFCSKLVCNGGKSTIIYTTIVNLKCKWPKQTSEYQNNALI